MLRLLTDENFNGDIIRGLLLQRPSLDLVHVQSVGLAGADDPTVLAWTTSYFSWTTAPTTKNGTGWLSTFLYDLGSV